MRFKNEFWLANAQEACERLAYFGIRAILPLMMVSVGTGGLGLSMAQKGLIYGIWALIQCFVPMVSGGFSETFGYKKSLIVAFVINTCGYLIMANVLNIAEVLTGTAELNNTANFWIMMLGGCTIGLGTAIFKPPVQGTVAKSLTEENSGVGFGIFYWIVNIGGFLAPMVATALRGDTANPTWHYVFYGAAFVTLFNLALTILLFKEPVRTEEEIEENKKKNAVEVFVKTMKILWEDKNILLFLLIVSGFWFMFMQLWDLLPNFIEEWVDRRSVGGALVTAAEYLKETMLFSWLGSIFLSWTDDGAIKPEMIINIDSFTIILLVLVFSKIFSRYKMMTALVVGMVISVIGFVLTGVTTSGAICCLAVFIFAIGEIICSPKFNEYIGMTAPPDKKAIYMGFSNMPFAIGWGLGNLLSGFLYDGMASKRTMGIRWLHDHSITTASYQGLDLAGSKKWLLDNGFDEANLSTKLESRNFNFEQLMSQISDNFSVESTSSAIQKIQEALSVDGLDLSAEAIQGIVSKIQSVSPGLSYQTFVNACQTANDCISPQTEKFIAQVFDSVQNQALWEQFQTLIVNNFPKDVPLEYFDANFILNNVKWLTQSADKFAVNDILWSTQHPWIIWLVLGAVGLASMIGMIVFYYKSGMHEAEEQNKEGTNDADGESDPFNDDQNEKSLDKSNEDSASKTDAYKEEKTETKEESSRENKAETKEESSEASKEDKVETKEESSETSKEDKAETKEESSETSKEDKVEIKEDEAKSEEPKEEKSAHLSKKKGKKNKKKNK